MNSNLVNLAKFAAICTAVFVAAGCEKDESAPASESGVVAAPFEMKTKTITLPGGATMEMIWCPPGTYTMGAPETEPGRVNDGSYKDLKCHKVTLTKGFWLGRYEVTQGQFRSVMGSAPEDSFHPENNDPALPVDNLSWEEAEAFIKACGNGVRFPTEAEWEYACRAGTTTPFPWGSVCNGTECNCNGTEPLGTDSKGPFLERLAKGGSYPPNAWGFYDMNGNVAELCSDWWNKKFNESIADSVDPQGASSEDEDIGPRKIKRGGSYCHRASNCRSATRGMTELFDKLPGVGLRLAVDE